MSGHGGREPGAQLRREVAGQQVVERRVVGQVGVQDDVAGLQLGVGQQHRQLGAGERLPVAPALHQGTVVGQRLDAAHQPARPLQRPQEALVGVQQAARRRHLDGERRVLRIVVGQDGGGDLVGHLTQQRGAAGGIQLAVVDDPVQRDLDVDLVVGGVDTRGVVDRVGVQPPAGQGVLDAAALGEPEVAPLPHDPDAQLRAVDPHGVVGLVPHVQGALGGRLHVGADATVEEQVDRRREDRADEIDRRHRLDAGGDAQRRPHGRRERNRLRRPRPHPAAGADP
jgi:hypothetical protein